MYGHKNQRIKELRDAGYNTEKAYVCREERHRHIGTNWVYRLNEPLLGPLPSLSLEGIDWVIVGGESGPRARPMHPEWVSDIRDRCVDAGVAFFFKQWGEWSPGSTFATEPQDVLSRILLDDGRVFSFNNWQDVGYSLEPYKRGSATIVTRRGRRRGGRDLDGRTWDEFPQVVVS
jgi:protein gp37